MAKNNNKTLQAKNGKISTKSKQILKNGAKKAPKKHQKEEKKTSSKVQQQPKEMWDYFQLDAKYHKL